MDLWKADCSPLKLAILHRACLRYTDRATRYHLCPTCKKFFEPDIAVKINLWFLAFVAAWRVALLIRLYAVLGEMNRLQTAECSTLPVSLIIFIISSAGFANQIVNAMGGLRKDEPQNVDFLTRISGTAFLLSIVVGTTAFVLWIAEQVKARKSG